MRIVLRILLIVIGIVALAWFLIPPALTGNFHIGSFTGGAIGLVLSLYGVFFSKINTCIVKAWKYVVGKFVIILVSTILVAIITLAILCIISMAHAQKRTPQANSTVIVLGCHVYDYGPSATLQGRLDVALDYLMKNPESLCIVCGGQGDNEPVTEASAMYDYLVEKGIDSSRIYIEDKSADTLENLSNALDIINENQLNENVAIITNDYHLYRAGEYAKSTGFDSPGMLGSNTLWWLFPGLVVREMYGILEMWFLR